MPEAAIDHQTLLCPAVVWSLAQAAVGSLPGWLLWFATLDAAFVAACLPGVF